MFNLKPPRHISTLPIASFWPWAEDFRCSAISGHAKRPILRQKYPTASECARRHLSFRAIGRRHAERNERIGAVMGERPVFGRICPRIDDADEIDPSEILDIIPARDRF